MLANIIAILIRAQNVTITPHVSATWCPADGRVISVETFYHTLDKIWHDQDQGETTVMNGEWSQRDRREVHRKTRRQLVQVVR